MLGEMGESSRAQVPTRDTIAEELARTPTDDACRHLLAQYLATDPATPMRALTQGVDEQTRSRVERCLKKLLIVKSVEAVGARPDSMLDRYIVSDVTRIRFTPNWTIEHGERQVQAGVEYPLAIEVRQLMASHDARAALARMLGRQPAYQGKGLIPDDVLRAEARRLLEQIMKEVPEHMLRIRTPMQYCRERILGLHPSPLDQRERGGGKG